MLNIGGKGSRKIFLFFSSVSGFLITPGFLSLFNTMAKELNIKSYINKGFQ